METLVSQADQRLAEIEGHALEDLAGQVYEERSRRGMGDFALTERIRGYWDRGDVEIDLVAVGEEHRRLRFGTCKRSAERLPASVEALHQNAQRFIATHRRFEGWRIDFAAIAPDIPEETRRVLDGLGVIPQSLADLTSEL